MRRARMVSLRATSAPLRSSAGCGSYTPPQNTQKEAEREEVGTDVRGAEGGGGEKRGRSTIIGDS